MSISLIPQRWFPGYEEVTPELLHQYGVRLLLCDLDYTLAPKSVKLPDPKVRAWVRELEQEGICVMVLSNNRSGTRVSLFCGELGIPYIRHAGKPGTRGLRAAMEQAGVNAGQTAMLGDKLLTDVLAARRAGVLSLMVEPRGGAIGPWQKVLHLLQAPFKYAAVQRQRGAKREKKKHMD